MESKILKLLNLRLGLNNKKTEHEEYLPPKNRKLFNSNLLMRLKKKKTAVAIKQFDVTGVMFNEGVYGLKKMLRFSHKLGLLFSFSRLFHFT